MTTWSQLQAKLGNTKKYDKKIRKTPGKKTTIVKPSTKPVHKVDGSKTPDDRAHKPGKYLALDCEFVGTGPQGHKLALARALVVNIHGHVIFDEYVRPKERVTDWRTKWSGIQPKDIIGAIEEDEAKVRLEKLFQGRVIVGHAVYNDLGVLGISIPRHLIRDTSKLASYREMSKGKPPSLRTLARRFLNKLIQTGEHDLVEDARATMELFLLRKKEFKFE